MNNKTLRSFVSHSFSAAFVLAAAVRMHGDIGADMDSAENSNSSKNQQT